MAWTDKILRVDLSDRKSWTEDTEPYKPNLIGGVGISAKIIYDEIGPEVGPYDPENRLCFSPGVLAGTMAPTHSRATVTSISPNGFANDSGIGGQLPAAIKKAGYDNITIQGKADEPIYLYINDDRVEFRSARHLLGLDTQATQRVIKDEIGDSAAVCAIGPTGEKLVSFSCLVTGKGSAAARGGFGAVMGSKNLKALAVRGSGQPRSPKHVKFVSYCQDLHQRMPDICDIIVLQHKQGHGDKYTLGGAYEADSAVLGNWADYGALADCGPDKGPEEFYDQCASHQYGCHGCPVHHFHIFNLPGRGTGTTKCTQWVCFVTQVWNRDRRILAQANTLCQNYGLDSCGASVAVAFLMDLYHRSIITDKDTDGVPMKKGDERAILTAVEKIGKQEGFGRLFRNGVLGAAREIGRGAEEFAVQVNGQELEPYEVRAYKQNALCTALTDGSVAHGWNLMDFAWVTEKEIIEDLAEEVYGAREAAVATSYGYKGLTTMTQENANTAGNITGSCKWVWPWGVRSLEVPARLFSLGTGREMSEEELKAAAERIHTLQRADRSRRGLRRDDLPERLFRAPVADGRFKGEKLDRAGFDQMLDEYYALRGWDKNGIPKKKTFIKLGLTSEWEEFKRDMGQEVKKDGA